MLTPPTRLRLCRARDRLREEHHLPLGIDRIAREACMSESHFIRRFAAVFGETPHQYRIRARLEEARRRLVLGQGSITEICMAVGFSSLGSFSSLFSRRFGEPPSAYRRRLLPSLEVPGRIPLALGPGCTSLMTAAFVQIGRFSRSAGNPGALSSGLHQPGDDA